MTSRLLAVLLVCVAMPVAAAVTVHSGGSIQAALDAAPAGSTVIVLPGTYHEAGWPHALTVTKDGIHLVGRPRPGRPVVLERAANQQNGLWVSPTDSLAPADAELPPCGESHALIHKFTVQGLTVRGFPGYGMYLACVQDFTVRHNTAEANRTYAIFPVRSSRGRVAHNAASGTFTDACIYVGESDHVQVDHNTATDCQIGLQMENTRNVRFEHNRSTGNTAGLIVDVIGGRATLVAADNAVTRNVIENNNRLNSGAGSSTAGLVPGIGIVIDGADRTLVAHNVIAQNSLAGMTLLDFCIGDPTACADPGLAIDPYPDGNEVIRNRFTGNGINVVFAPRKGKDNCFAGNRPDPLQPDVTLPACP